MVGRSDQRRLCLRAGSADRADTARSLGSWPYPRVLGLSDRIDPRRLQSARLLPVAAQPGLRPRAGDRDRALAFPVAVRRLTATAETQMTPRRNAPAIFEHQV